jgi:hypothetical protein
MKFIHTLLIAIVALAFAGCAKKDGAASSPSSSSPAANIPAFSSAAVNDYVKAYSQFCDEYVAAYKSKDASKIQAISAKMGEWGAKSQEAMKGLKADEVQKFSDWITKKSQELSEAVTAAAK